MRYMGIAAFCSAVIVKQPSSDNTPYEKIGDEVRSLAWEWVRLGNAFAIEMGQSPAGNTVSGNCTGTEFHQVQY